MYTIAAAPSATRTLGPALFTDKSGTSFRVWAPFASAVEVLLQPDSATPATVLSLSQDGLDAAYWSADIDGAVVGHLYQFSIKNRGGDQFDPGDRKSVV